MTLDDWRTINWFRRQEFLCKHCSREDMQYEFLQKLDYLRSLVGRPLIVSSGFRCSEYNAQVSETGANGPHTTGRAVDISVMGLQAFQLLEKVVATGMFTGIGINQKGGARFIHLDDLKAGRPYIWSY